MGYSCAFVVKVSNKSATVVRVCVAAFIVTFVAIRSADCTEPSPTAGHIVSRISRQPVESSAIAKVGYSKRHHILEIEFINGAVYRYLDVPAMVYRDLMAAESKARFYDSNIRQHYRSVLMQSRQARRSSAKSTE
jgi:hypothetical protein